jgi:hypothetical protein
LHAVLSFFCILITLSCSPSVFGQNAEPAKVARVVKVESAPTVDGKLDEELWKRAEPITDFHQIRPGDGTPPTERTEVYLIYDQNALYIGARMYDSDPEQIAAPTMRHGLGLGSDDRLVVILDPFNTGRAGYRFETNLNAVRHESLYDDVNSFQSEWTVIWNAAATTFEDGWIAELEIPFKTLPFDPAIDTWGFNFGRGIRRRGEEIAWVSRNRTYNPSIMGLAVGFEGLTQGVGLDIVPSATINQQKVFGTGETESNLEPSLDVFYRLRPSLNASLTLNTDFSASEVDDRQVNLTRFSLFFPEKRDFFLNDSDLFEFGRISGGGFQNNNRATTNSTANNGRPFFSRRLGLSSSGTPVDLKVGGKLSGRLGRWNIGALALRQDGFGTVLPSNVLVTRVSANVLQESTLGMIATKGDPSSNLDNSVVGMDFRYVNTRFRGRGALESDAWFQQSRTEGRSGGQSAFGLGIRMPNNSGWRGGAGVKQLGRNFNPALGFISRTNIRDTTADVGYTHFTRNSFLQTISAGVDMERITFLDGGLQSEVIVARLIELRDTAQDRLEVQYTATKEVLIRPFTIYEDASRQVVIPPGRYSFAEKVVTLQTAGQRIFSGSLTMRTGDFYDGGRDNINGQLSWRQFSKFRATVNYDWNRIDLPHGLFITRLMRFTTEVNFSTRLSWVTLTQYDNVSEVIGVNTRLRWIPKAGQEGLFVLNHSLQDRDNDNSFQSELADISFKAGYTFRF